MTIIIVVVFAVNNSDACTQVNTSNAVRRSHRSTAGCPSLWFSNCESLPQRKGRRKPRMSDKQPSVVVPPPPDKQSTDQPQTLPVVPPPDEQSTDQPQTLPVVPPPPDEQSTDQPQTLPVVQPPDEQFTSLQLSETAVNCSTSKGLRCNEKARHKIQEILAEYNDGSDARVSFEDSSDEYVPSGQHRTLLCDVVGCNEEIFIACFDCPSVVCYDHVHTTCEEHRRVISTQEVSNDVSCSVSSSDVSDVEPKKSRKRKRAISELTVGTERPRKRKRLSRTNLTRHYKTNPDNWERNRRKKLRSLGQEYVNTRGKVSRAKTFLSCECKHGRIKVLKCTDFSDADREEIHSGYYATGSYVRQRDFIRRYVHKISSPKGKRKNSSLCFTLPIAGVPKRVCKRMFLKTLDISERLVLYTLRKGQRENNCTFSPDDQRGRHAAHNKSSDGLLDSVRKHIEQFPTVDPHYTRADTNRKFLGSDLNIHKMYQLYKDQQQNKAEQFVKVGVYRKVFCDEYNYSFHQPKKDACKRCEQYSNADDAEKVQLQQEFTKHIERKEQARLEKAADKERASTDTSWHAVTVDLQSVLTTPCGNVSTLYYARKLAVYNFTIYNQVSKDGYCMLWNETEGHRGANEIGSLIYLYLRDYLPADVKHVVITSDSMVSQNRNQYVTAILLVAAQILPHVESIEQKLMEPGHTEMEVDAMHATIDNARKHLKVNAPHEWPVVLRMARRRQPYEVRELQHGDFLDLHDLSSAVGTTNIKKDASGKSVNWMKIKSIRVKKGSTNEVEVKEAYDEAYRSVTLANADSGSDEGRKTRTKLKRSKTSPPAVSATLLKPAYKSVLPVSTAKKMDLVQLCKNGSIPSHFLSYYSELKTAAVEDCLPEPDNTELD